MAERLGIHRSTYTKWKDEIGLLLNVEQLPKRVRPKPPPRFMKRQIKLFISEKVVPVGILFFNASKDANSYNKMHKRCETRLVRVKAFLFLVLLQE